SGYTFTATASDHDLPGNALTFSLVGAPTGASIDASTGVFTWTPSEAQGPGSYTFKVRVTDDGSRSEERRVGKKCSVREVKVAQVLAGVLASATLDDESAYTFTATATDHDLPGNTLTFSLVGAPAGASIDADTGVFTWTPSEAQGPGDYTFKVRVTDDGSPNLYDEKSIRLALSDGHVTP